MRLIGAGLPRTATLSQKIGLEMIGLGPCYHMVDVLADLSLAAQWVDALEGNGDWDKIFAGYSSTVDWPGSFFLGEICDHFPNAKVLLSVRDPNDWARSMYDTIYGVLFGDTFMHDMSLARCRIDPLWAAYTDLMREVLKRSGFFAAAEEGLGSGALARGMQAWTDEVRATVPAERLLVWTAADGFEPLCEFMGLPLPDAPFPRVNDSDTFADRIIHSALETLNAWYENEETSGPQ